MLRVDPLASRPAAIDLARSEMLNTLSTGERITVPDDRTARQVLVLFGLTPDEADDVIRRSHTVPV
jgi:hypothetical protein